MPRQPDERLLTMWREIGEAIESGDIQGIFCVYEYAEDMASTGCAWRSGDVGVLLQSVKDHAIRVRARQAH